MAYFQEVNGIHSGGECSYIQEVNGIYSGGEWQTFRR